MRRPEARGWAAVVLVAAGAVVAQAFGRFTYGVLLPAIRNDLDHSNTVAGLLGTVNVGAYLIGTVAVATIATRLRLITVFRLGFAFSLTGLATAIAAPNAVALGGSLFVMGIGGAFIWIPSPALAAAQVGGERRGLAVGGIGAGIGLGILFAGQLARLMRSRSGDGAWRDVYAVEAALGLIVVAAVLLFLGHRRERRARRVDVSGRDADADDADRPGAQGGAGLAGFGALREMPGWIPLTASYAAYGFSYLLAISFLTSRLEDDAGYSEGLAATMFGFVGVGTVLGGVGLGMIADRVGERATMTGGFLAFAAAIGCILTGALPLVVAGSIGLGLMFAGLAAVTATYVVGNTTAERFGSSYAAATFAFGTSQMLSPQVGGLLADLTGDFTVVFALSGAFALVGAAASSRLPPSRSTER